MKQSDVCSADGARVPGGAARAADTDFGQTSNITATHVRAITSQRPSCDRSPCILHKLQLVTCRPAHPPPVGWCLGDESNITRRDLSFLRARSRCGVIKWWHCNVGTTAILGSRICIRVHACSSNENKRASALNPLNQIRYPHGIQSTSAERRVCRAASAPRWRSSALIH